MAFVGDTTNWPQHTTLHVPQDATLAALLDGPYAVRTGLAAAAMPNNGAQGTITVLQHHTGPLADELGNLLRQAREAGHPGADALASVAGQLGIVEVQAEPEPAPEASF